MAMFQIQGIHRTIDRNRELHEDGDRKQDLEDTKCQDMPKGCDRDGLSVKGSVTRELAYQTLITVDGCRAPDLR